MTADTALFVFCGLAFVVTLWGFLAFAFSLNKKERQ